MPESPTKPSKWTKALHLLVPVAIALSWTVSYLSQEVKNLAELYDSDGLFLEVIWVDIFQNGGQWSEWYPPHAPRFLPDMALYFGLRGFVPDEYWAIFLFGLITLFLVYIPAIWLASLLGQSRAAVFLTQGTILMTISFLAVEGLRPYSFLYAATFHTGILIHGLLLIIFYTYLRQNPSKVWPWGAITGLATVGAASDLIFVIAYLAPFCIVLILERLFLGPTFGVRLVPLITLGVGVGLLVKKLLVRDTTPAYFDFSNSWESAWTIPATFLGMFEQVPLTSSLCCIFYALLVVQTVSWFRARLKTGRHSQTPLPIWQLTFLLSAAILVLALGVRGLLEPTFVPEIKDSRLLISIPFNAVLLPWLPIRESLKRAKTEVLIAIAVLFVVVAVLVKFNPFTRQYYSLYRPPWIAELDRRLAEYEEESGRKLQRGVATYWPTKATLALTRHDLSLGQYSSNLEQYYCLSSTEWYHQNYDFAIVEFTEDDEKFLRNLIATGGLPERVYRCEDLRLVIFPPNALKADNFLVGLPKMQPGPSVERLPGSYSLFSPSKNQGNHIIIYGPYVRLDEGIHEVTLDFKIGDQEPAGSFRCEVYFSQEDLVVVEKTIELPTADRDVDVTMSFEVSKEKANSPVEFRVWKNGAFDLTLVDISLKKSGARQDR